MKRDGEYRARNREIHPPAYFPGYVQENLLVIADALDLTRAELVQLQRNAFEISWLPLASRDAYLAELEAYAAQP